MKGKYLRRIGGFILAALLIPGIAIVSNSRAQAQRGRRVIIVRPYRVYPPFYYRDPFWDPYWGHSRYDYYSQYVFSTSEKAFDQGYHDGLKTGEGDAKHHRSYNPERSHYFHDAGFGNYAEGYRDGFARGYADGFRA